MSRWSDHLHRRLTWAEGAIWATALLTVSAACAAAAILVPEPTESAGEAAPQAAIMIELAPEPEAVKTDANAVTEDRKDAAERPDPPQEAEPEREAPLAAALPPVPQTERAPEPVTPPEPKAKAEPPLETASLPEPPPVAAPDPLESQMLAALSEVDVPLPIARPKPEPRRQPQKAAEQRPEKKETERRRPKREPASAAQTQASAVAKSATRNAAQQTVASSSVSKGDSSRWKARVVAHLERRKRYPAAARARGEEGTVLVAFRIDSGGRVLSASLARSSGHSALDEAALAMVTRASPVPAPPEGTGTTLTAPVRFVRR